MRVIVSECVRYFQRPLCFRMPPAHVHTSRCWDQEFHELRELLFNSESDVRALEQGNKLLKQENFHLKEQIEPSSTRGVRGPRHSWISMDEASDWSAGGLSADAGDLSIERVQEIVDAFQADSRPTEPTTADIYLRRVTTPGGIPVFQTSDGKTFTHKSQAAKHAALLHKRGHGR